MNKIPKALTEWGPSKYATTTRSKIKAIPSYRRDEGVEYKSAEMSGGVCERKDKKEYTGTLVTGIGMMHKSNLIPIINEEQARDLANMRRTQ